MHLCHSVYSLSSTIIHQWDEAINNKLNALHHQLGLWPGAFRIIRCEESVFARIKNWPSLPDSLLPFEKERSYLMFDP